MKLGVVSTALAGYGFEAGLDRCVDLGLGAIEIACAGFQRDLTFGDPALLVRDADARARWLDELASRGLELSALALHGEPLSPDPAVAARYDEEFRAACALAELAGIDRLTLLAGVPEGAEGDRAPCWVASAFPPVNQEILAWQWERRVIPYWVEHAAVAAQHGCRLCFEMHPNDVVYNPQSFLRLREAVGPSVGVNFDPSHLFWQGIDTTAALAALAPHVFHVHAKDTALRRTAIRANGVLDATPFGRIADRAWSFRTVGYGHDEGYWRELLSTLREIGYDDVLSIEHEDEYFSLDDGLELAVRVLRPLLPAGAGAGGR